MDKDIFMASFEYSDEEDELCTQKSIDFVKKLAEDKYRVQNTDIEVSATGKPYFKYEDMVKFSISHAYKMCVVGFATEEIGIDIEKIRPLSNKIINKYYSTNEKDEIERCGNCTYERMLKITEIWTRKEAHCKCTGEGLTKENLLWDSNLSEGFIIRSICKDDYVISVCLYNKLS